MRTGTAAERSGRLGCTQAEDTAAASVPAQPSSLSVSLNNKADMLRAETLSNVLPQS